MAKNVKNVGELIHPDDAGVKPEPALAGVLTKSVVSLSSLGLPKKCRGGQVVEDRALEDGTRWCVYLKSGQHLGFAYEPGARPFGTATFIEVTVLDAYDDDTVQQAAA